jgi:hypothetical protein
MGITKTAWAGKKVAVAVTPKRKRALNGPIGTKAVFNV